MIHSALTSQIAELAGRYVRGEYGRPDGPVKVTVHLAANLQLISVTVEPLPAWGAVPLARPQRQPAGHGVRS